LSYLWDSGTQIDELFKVRQNLQNMFKDKGGKTIETKPVNEVKIANVLINMVDVHVTIQSKTSEKHVFKDQEPRKNKTKVEGNRKKLKKSM